MNKRILFIGNSQGFIIRAITESLAQEGFVCTSCPVDITQINNYVESTDYFFVNLDEDLVQRSEFFVFLRDTCSENEKKVFFTGYDEHLQKAAKVILPAYLGACFPRPINANEVVARIVKTVEAEGNQETQKHILVVDDSGEMLRTVKSWLSGKYKVSMANSAVNAISFLSNNTPDLILLDYEMPVCSGPQMLEMIRSEIKTESIPVIFLTGKSDLDSVKAVLALKPQGYILKSRAKEEILQTISDFFETQKASELQ